MLPADLSFFNSRAKNKEISANLGNKAVNQDYFGELFIVNSDVLKAICMISEKEKNGCGYNAVVNLYSPNEAVFISMMLFWYKDKAALKSDLLSILGGLTMPNQPLQANKVKNDISAIVKKFSKTEQTH